MLVLAHSSELISMQELKLPENLEGIAVIEITDPIREGLQILLVFALSRVDLKIISGDNPVTVSYIAQQAGFKIMRTTSIVPKISDDQLVDQAEETAIFGRVSPHQKKLLIQTLKAAGRTTAMTGDGSMISLLFAKQTAPS